MGELIRFWKLPEECNKLLLSFELEYGKFLFEKYKRDRYRIQKFFYVIKPLIPRVMQIQIRRAKAKSTKNNFPNWPIEPYLEKFKKERLKDLIFNNRFPFIWFWPNNKNFVFCLTHDVETKKGLKNIEKIVEIEKKYGFRSSFFFVPEDYDVHRSLIRALQKDGFEVGVHGLKHDGRLFNSYNIFQNNIKKIKKYADEWNANGFRSPSLLRHTEWMKELPFEYDSSFPDTDPFGPQPGGCLSIFPFFLGNLVELPVTLAQDHTLFVILKKNDIKIWKQKIDWIEKKNGVALVIVHPDYFDKKVEKYYMELLDYVSNKENYWHALPILICDWWRRRDRASLVRDAAGNWTISGDVSNASIQYINNHLY